MRFTTKYESTMKQWNEILAKAEKKLQESEKCFEKFGDEDSKQWMEEDRAEVERIKKNIEIVKQNLKKYGLTA